MKRRIHTICLLFAGLAAPVPPALADAPFDAAFADGARICFLGDSITKQAQWNKVVQDYYYTRFPDRRFAFINAGIAGDTASGCLSRLDEDVIAQKPDVITVMFGMNDVGRGFYVTNPTPQQIERRNAMLARYEEKLPQISEVFARKLPAAKVCWVTPSPYDEFARIEKPAQYGCGKALENCAEIVRRHAASRGDRLCELYAPMAEFNARERAADPSFTTLCGVDRIHPAAAGGFFMAQTILKSWGAPACVSDVTIDAGSGRCTSCENAEVSSLSVEGGGVSFTLREKALPMPVAKEAQAVAEKVAFAETLNREFLRVKNLPDGNWTLAIDGAVVTVAPAAAWRDGVNLSAFPTPQSGQAAKVAALNSRRMSLETKLRTLAGERHYLRSKVKNIDDWDEVKRVVKSLEGQKGFFQERLPWYVAEWPSHGAICDEIRKLEDAISAANRPVPHRYALTR